MKDNNRIRFWVTLSNEWPDGDKVIGVEYALDNCSADTVYMTECDDVGDAADQVVEYRDKAKEQWPDEEIYLSIFGNLAEFSGNDGDDISVREDVKLYYSVFDSVNNLVKKMFPQCPHCGEYAYSLDFSANDWSGEDYCSTKCANEVREYEEEQSHKDSLSFSAVELKYTIPEVLDNLRSRLSILEEGGHYLDDVQDAIDALVEVMDNLSKETEDEKV